MYLLIALLIAYFASAPTLNAPVTALYADGDRLLIGQGALLIDARVAADAVTITRAVDLKRGAIRAIAVIKSVTLVLSEDGLSALSPGDNSVIDYAPGGGQRLSVRGSRVYVAALNAGVRVLSFENGKFKPITRLAAHGSTEDVAAEGAAWVWAAEGDQGVRLYDLTDPAKPTVIYEAPTLRPARLVRVNGTRLIVGYANKVTVLDTTSIKSPRTLGEVTLGSETAYASDALVDRSTLVIGRVDVSGADALLIDLSAPGTIRARDGDSGGGDRIALSSAALFVGSERAGLRRLSLTGSALRPMTAWTAAIDSAPCGDPTPVNPLPVNLSEIPRADSVTLRWGAACPSARYEVRINGQVAATVSDTQYTFTPRTETVTWQIVALTGDHPDQRTESPRWSFDLARDGYLSASPAPRLEAVLYTPPRPLVTVSLDSPLAVIAATCAAGLIGLIVIVGGAVAISAWAERRVKGA